MKTYHVYIITNKNNTVLYTGVTGNMARRLEEHSSGANTSAFTRRYNINKLVFVEGSPDIEAALNYEKRIKSWSRKKKIDLIEKDNPNWDDLGKKFNLIH